jgi:hypothetical protein
MFLCLIVNDLNVSYVDIFSRGSRINFIQVLTLGHTILATITKAASIIPDEMFIDMMPVAWELLIESDQELAAAAGLSTRKTANLRCF